MKLIVNSDVMTIINRPLKKYLVHSVHPDSISSIFESGYLYSLNTLRKKGIAIEPSSFYKLDSFAEKDFIEFSPPELITGELVVNSRDGLNIRNIGGKYQPSVRLFFYKDKLEKHKNAEKGELSLRIKDELELTGNVFAAVFPNASVYENNVCKIKDEILSSQIKQNHIIASGNFISNPEGYISESNKIIQSWI